MEQREIVEPVAGILAALSAALRHPEAALSECLGSRASQRRADHSRAGMSEQVGESIDP